MQGTGSVRVALFDFRGQNRAYAVAEYGTTYPKKWMGRAERLRMVWGIKESNSWVYQEAGIAADNIAAITCDARGKLSYLQEGYDFVGESLR